MCGRSPYKVLEPQVYDMRLLGDTRIYQEGSISPPCMVLLQPEQQEELACVLLVNGEAMCSQEELQGDKSKPPSLSLSLSGEEPNAKLERCAASSHLLLQQTHFTSLKICKTVTQCVRQSMRKHTLKSQQTAVKPHNSPCLSSCIFKAECSLWI